MGIVFAIATIIAHAGPLDGLSGADVELRVMRCAHVETRPGVDADCTSSAMRRGSARERLLQRRATRVIALRDHARRLPGATIVRATRTSITVRTETRLAGVEVREALCRSVARPIDSGRPAPPKQPSAPVLYIAPPPHSAPTRPPEHGTPSIPFWLP